MPINFQELMDERTQTFSLEQLRDKSTLPEGIDTTNLEMYLNDETFEKVRFSENTNTEIQSCCTVVQGANQHQVPKNQKKSSRIKTFTEISDKLFLILLSDLRLGLGLFRAFQTFKMTKEAFGGLAQWRQIRLRKDAGLF